MSRSQTLCLATALFLIFEGLSPVVAQDPPPPPPTLTIEADGDVGIGTATPDARLHSMGSVLISESDDGIPAAELLEIESDFDNGARIRFDDGPDGDQWNVGAGITDTFLISATGSTAEFILTAEGDLHIRGRLTATDISTMVTATFPDYVFESEYELMPLMELADFITAEGHLPRIPSAEDVEKAGTVDVGELQLLMLEKIEELTLYTIQQHETIEDLKAEVEALKSAQ